VIVASPGLVVAGTDPDGPDNVSARGLVSLDCVARVLVPGGGVMRSLWSCWPAAVAGRAHPQSTRREPGTPVSMLATSSMTTTPRPCASALRNAGRPTARTRRRPPRTGPPSPVSRSPRGPTSRKDPPDLGRRTRPAFRPHAARPSRTHRPAPPAPAATRPAGFTRVRRPPGRSPPRADGLRRGRRDYQADAVTRRASPATTLIIVAGLPATGKTTFARLLAKRLHAASRDTNGRARQQRRAARPTSPSPATAMDGRQSSRRSASSQDGVAPPIARRPNRSALRSFDHHRRLPRPVEPWW
jgi:hypothetical protein